MPPSNTPLAALRAISRYSAKSTTKSYAPLRLASRPRQQQPSIHHIIPSTLSTRFYSSSSQDSSSPPPSPPQTSSTFPRPLTDRTSTPSPNFSHTPRQRPPKPEYQITFTCDPCSTRSTHKISKQGYHKGSVLISCPECKNRHVISDHLGVSTLLSTYVLLLFCCAAVPGENFVALRSEDDPRPGSGQRRRFRLFDHTSGDHRLTYDTTDLQR